MVHLVASSLLSLLHPSCCFDLVLALDLLCIMVSAPCDPCGVAVLGFCLLIVDDEGTTSFLWPTTTSSVTNLPSHIPRMASPYGNPAQGDSMTLSKWATLVSFAKAISSACSMSYIQEIIHPIEISPLSRMIMNNCNPSPGIFAEKKFVRVLDKTLIISARRM
jgi:hypothetical protein